MSNATLWACLAALSFVACDANPASGNAASLNGTKWTLSSLTAHAPVIDSRVTLWFEAGRIQGSDGCNRYSGPYTASTSKLTIGPDVASTLMGCETALMEQASAYMTALLAVQSYRVDDKALQLLGADGRVLATFSAQSQSPAG